MQNERSVPRPTRPAELVELRQAEPLGVLDDHHAGVRDVDPDLDDGGRHEHVHLAGREGGHRRVARVRALLAVDEADAQRRQPLAQSLRLRLRRRRLEGGRLHDERDDDERLAARGRLVGQEGLDLRQRPRSRISVRIGWRPGGSSRIVLIARSP